MAIPSPGALLRCEVGGTCFVGETWAVGVDLWNPLILGISLPTQAEMDAIALQVLNTFNTTIWGPSLDAVNDASVNLRNSRASLYQSGTLTGSGAASISPVPGTGTATHPGYTAMCVSQLTSFSGRSSKGRRYLPITAGLVDATTGQFNPTTMAAIVNDWVDFLDALAALSFTWAGAGHTLAAAVVSTTTTNANFITSVRTDSRPDVIRNRVRSSAPLNTVSVPV